MLKKVIFISALISFFSAQAYSFELEHPVTSPVTITKPGNKMQNFIPEKNVTIMKIKLTTKERNILLNFNPKTSSTIYMNSRLPSNINLGMNDVPVLDQGSHGSCVTFAVTAALDAALGKGDYISQLCNLELGAYLENNSYQPGGWNGSTGYAVIEQITRFGIVNKNNQQSKTCAGITTYPLNDPNNEGNPISLEEFRQLSEDLTDKIYPIYRMSFQERFDAEQTNPDFTKKFLEQIKQSLANGNRLTLGVLLVLTPYCGAGACAKAQAKNDTWALTREIDYINDEIGGHEMIVIGYDDKAIATDSEGRQHRGLLTLRNSWGDNVGDHGNYYMTYDYFKKFVFEIHEIVSIKEG